MVECSTVTKHHRTHWKVQGFKNLCCLLPLGSASGYAVEHDSEGLIACVPDEFNGRGNCLEVIGWKGGMG